MDFLLLKPEIQEFLKANLHADLPKLAFQKNPFPEIEWKEILNQIAARHKARTKLPTWFETPNIIYPSKVSVEQTSSEKTAFYKSNLVSGQSLIDLTGGFGVDDFYFSKAVSKVHHCEMNTELSKIVARNFKTLGVQNVTFYNDDSTNVLRNQKQQFDWIYIDPSRRSDTKGKVFMLKDCLPNVPELLDFYFSNSKNILIKTAPILDISAGLTELKNVKKIHIVAVENEVKELLWELRAGFSAEMEMKTVNIVKDKMETFDFFPESENAASHYGLPKKYLYEPNSAIMKSGGFDAIGARFGLEKLHPHSHLYTSDVIISFPGRVFEIEIQISFNKNEMKNCIQNKKMNVTTRNFPETVENLRKKWNIKEGGSTYCFFTTDVNNNKIALICSKM